MAILSPKNRNKYQTTLEQALDCVLKERNYTSINKFFYNNNGVWIHRNLDHLSDIQTCVVIRHLDWDELLSGLFVLHKVTPREVMNTWYQNFSKTIFLVGNPKKIEKKYKNILVYNTSNIAITSIGENSTARGMKRMLRQLTTYADPSGLLPDCLGKKHNGQREYVMETYVHQMSLERILVHWCHMVNDAIYHRYISEDDTLHCKWKKSYISYDCNSKYHRIDIDEINASNLTLFCQLHNV